MDHGNIWTDALMTQTYFLPRSVRFAGYKQYTWCIHNRLGKGVRKVLPSCALGAIRDKYPEESGVYVPFMERQMNDQHEDFDTDSD